MRYSIGEKPYFAVGFPNDAGGWELRNPWFKGGSSPKHITTLSYGSDTAAVFEGFMDFLSFMAVKDTAVPLPDIAVLNSVVNVPKAVPFLSAHRSLRLYLDNDEAGRKAAAGIIRLCPGPEITDCSRLYPECKDFNE